MNERLEKAVNRQESVKLWAELHGRYSDYVHAYSSKDSKLRRYWENVIVPEVIRFCGQHWGENPQSTLHPIGYQLLKRNGLI